MTNHIRNIHLLWCTARVRDKKSFILKNLFMGRTRPTTNNQRRLTTTTTNCIFFDWHELCLLSFNHLGSGQCCMYVRAIGRLIFLCHLGSLLSALPLCACVCILLLNNNIHSKYVVCALSVPYADVPAKQKPFIINEAKKKKKLTKAKDEIIHHCVCVLQTKCVLFSNLWLRL